MILAAMLVTLGFLLATLLGLLIAPAIWGRAARLTRRRIEATMPMSLGEIEAAQDRVRATYAVRLRRLETALSRSKQKAALQLVDNSRLQMQLAALKDTVQQMELQLEERRNAATVFEQTIRKRFPELDKQIEDLGQDLRARTQEVIDLTNKRKRKDESLEAARRHAATVEAELTRVREALEKGSGDRSARLLRRPSQWTLDDYRSEYDRLNLELSKMRQQLAQMTDRESHQIALVKSELQRLSELILVASETKPAPAPAIASPEAPPIRLGAPKPPEPGARPLPWPRERGMSIPLSRPAPLAERLRNTPDGLEASPRSEATREAPSGSARDEGQPRRAKPSAAPQPPGASPTAGQTASARPDAAASAPPDAAAAAPRKSASLDTIGAADMPMQGSASVPASLPDAPTPATDAPLSPAENGETRVPGESKQVPPRAAETSDSRRGPAGLNGSRRTKANETPSGGSDNAPERATAASHPSTKSAVKAETSVDGPARDEQTRAPAEPEAGRAPPPLPVPKSPVADDAAEDTGASEPLAKPLSDARELRALSELLTMNAGSAPAAKPAQPDISREARQGFVIEGEASDASDTPSEPRERKGKRSLLDRLRNAPEPAEAEK